MAVKHYDFFIKGTPEVIVAYLDGYLRGKGVRGGYLFTEDLPFQSHTIKEFLKYRGDVIHVICRGSLRPVIRAAIRQGSEEHDFEFVDSRSLKSAYFGFKFKTANKQVAGTIKRLLRRLPAGVKVVDFKPCEAQNPGAKGAEGYAPLHHYSYRGEGIVRGNIESVLKLYYRFSANDFLHCEEIDLDY